MTERITTGDGSATLFVPALNETYHSRHGALAESRHVFIEAGLKAAFLKFGTRLNILEVGFGTGLNALLTLQEARTHGIEVWYTALELNPLSPDLLDGLDYARASGHPEDENTFRRMHDLPFNVAGEVTDLFTLEKRLVDAREFSDSPYRYHVVYFDAFAPKVQPELWTPEVFKRLRAVMAPDGVLVTYSSKSDVRRCLEECGFKTEKIPGPPGKREMLRAYSR